SAFTHVMAGTLAESPSDPLHRKLRQLRCLRCRLDCRVERTSSRAGVAPAEVQRLFTAHCFANNESCAQTSARAKRKVRSPSTPHKVYRDLRAKAATTPLLLLHCALI